MTAGTKDEYTEVNWMGNTEPDMEYGPDTTSTKKVKQGKLAYMAWR